jgi:hypothetical protein
LLNFYFVLQAIWRGYSLRCRLERALDFAKFEDDEEFGEVDMGDFNFMVKLLQIDVHAIANHYTI